MIMGAIKASGPEFFEEWVQSIFTAHLLRKGNYVILSISRCIPCTEQNLPISSFCDYIMGYDVIGHFKIGHDVIGHSKVRMDNSGLGLSGIKTVLSTKKSNGLIRMA